MPNDLMLQSGSPTAMAAEKRRLKAETGIRNLQIIGALSLYQGHQLSKSVENLNANLANQSALLETIAGGIGAVASKIDDVKREQVMARLKQEREDIAKEAVFQFKQECDRLQSEKNAFTAFFHYRALAGELEESGISTRDLPTIADKQYLADVEAAVVSGMERCREAFTDQENADLETFEDLIDYELEDVEGLVGARPLMLSRRFSELEQNPHLLSKGDLEETLGDLKPADLGKYYKGLSYVWWPLGFAALVSILPLAESRFDIASALAVLSWLAALALVFIINVLRAVFPSRKRLEATKNRILDRVRQDHKYTFEDGVEKANGIRSVIAEIELRRERARSLLERYEFLSEPLQPYFQFTRPQGF